MKGQITIIEYCKDGSVIEHKRNNLVLKNMKALIAMRTFRAINDVFPINLDRATLEFGVSFLHLIFGTGGYLPGDDYSSLPKPDYNDQTCFKASKTPIIQTLNLPQNNLPFPKPPINDPKGSSISIYSKQDGTIIQNYFGSDLIQNFVAGYKDEELPVENTPLMNGFKVRYSSDFIYCEWLKQINNNYVKAPTIDKNGKISLVEFSLCGGFLQFGKTVAKDIVDNSYVYCNQSNGASLFHQAVTKVIEPFEISTTSKIRIIWEIYV